jgi:2-methylisocitrate lyase-like PEP mutase family enzyme
MNLRARLSENLLLAPGVYDALTALIAEQAGAEAVYLSGASIAYSRLGRPDIGLVSVTETAEIIAALRDRISVPIIADADNGFGNALNVQRTVRMFERMGANALQLEDQAIPKRCGHLLGKKLIPKDEMVGKLHAALDARANADTLIIARTDAISVDGFDQALERAEAYTEAGADILFVEAPQSLEQLHAIVSQFGNAIPLMANMIEGGRTPILPAKELGEMGFSLAIFPGGIARALAVASQDYYRNLLAKGSNAEFKDRMLDFDGLNDLIGTYEMLAQGRKYDEEIE